MDPLAPLLLKGTVDKIDRKMARVFLPWALYHPRYLRGFLRLYRTHKSSSRIRGDAFRNGKHIPPFLIISITRQCNLGCAGCYAAAVGTTCKSAKPSLTWGQWRSVIEDAKDTGVFGFVIAGGEPFLFPGLIKLCEESKDRFFIILTNGTSIKEEDFSLLKKCSNIAVLVSIEGGLELTDARRGQGVYGKALGTLNRLEKIGTLSGISVTITRRNFEYWMEEKNIDDLINKGIRIAAFIEYIPTTSEGADRSLMLGPDENRAFRDRMLEYRREKPIYLIHSPGDEEKFGGCVSAGRGFAHVTPSGDLTPCPVSNLATHNLTKSSLREGLESPLFKEIRESEHLLETKGMPCALFAHPKEVNEIAKSVGAYRTDRPEL